MILTILTHSQTTNFRCFQIETVPKFDEKCIKFSIWVENTVGKGEIARYERFLLFQQCFKRIVLQTRKNQGLFWKGLYALSLNKSSTFIQGTDNIVNPLPDGPIKTDYLQYFYYNRGEKLAGY